jgi:hypothetical protein
MTGLFLWGEVMKKARYWIVLIGLLLISASTSDAQVFFEITPELYRNRPANKQVRLSFAKSLRKKFQEMYDAVPNLSPSQVKWLNTEMSSKNTYRKLKALESDEYYLQNTKRRIKNFLTGLAVIIEGKFQDPQGRRIEVDQRHKIWAWLGIASELMNYWFLNDIVTLVNRGLVNFSDERFGNRDVMLTMVPPIGQSILDAIVGPYILGTLPE